MLICGSLVRCQRRRGRETEGRSTLDIYYGVGVDEIEGGRTDTEGGDAEGVAG